MTRPVLGTLDLMELGTTGFEYPGTAQVVKLLSDGTALGGNAVVQASGFGLREARVTWFASTADVATARGYYEAAAAVTFTDRDAIDHSVILTAFSAAVRVGDWWDVQATLVEVG